VPISINKNQESGARVRYATLFNIKVSNKQPSLLKHKNANCYA